MRIVWLLTICSFALGCSQQFIMGIPGLVAASCGVSLTEVGQLMTVFSIAGAIGTPLLLAYTSRVAQRNQLLIGLGMMAAGMLVMGVSSSYPLFLGVRVLMGLGAGLYNATAMVLATRLAEPGKQASALANMALGSSASQIIAMPLAQIASAFVDWHVFYLVLAAYVALACVLIAKVVPLADVAGSLSAQGVTDSTMGLKERLAPLHDRRIVLALAVMVFLNVGYASYYTYVTPFLDNTFGDQGHMVSAVLFVSAIMSAVGAKCGGWLTDARGFRTTCTLVLVLQIATLAGLAALHASPVAVWILMCLWVMADWGFNPSQNLLITRLAGTGAPMALALSGSALQLGNALGAALGGAFILVAPLSALPFVSSAAVVVALGLEVRLLAQVPSGRVRRT